MKPSEAAGFRVQRNRRMSIAWLVAGTFMFAFGSSPWALLIFSPHSTFNITTHWPSLFILLPWSSFGWVTGLWLMYLALCRIELIATRGTLIRRSSLGPIHRQKSYREFHRCYLAYLRHRSRHRSTQYLTLLVRIDGKKKVLLNELTCHNLPELFAWIETNSHIKCHNLADRSPFG